MTRDRRGLAPLPPNVQQRQRPAHNPFASLRVAPAACFACGAPPLLQYSGPGVSILFHGTVVVSMRHDAWHACQACARRLDAGDAEGLARVVWRRVAREAGGAGLFEDEVVRVTGGVLDRCLKDVARLARRLPSPWAGPEPADA